MTFEPMLVIPQADFEKNASADISAHIQTQQNLSYLPWGVSLSMMRKYNPALAVGFEEDKDGNPFFVVPGKGTYLLAYVFDKETGKRTPSIFYPVRDMRRKSSEEVMLDTIGNQQQRAVAKVIAQEVGIGWSLYSKYDESIPLDDTAVTVPVRNPGTVAPAPAGQPKPKPRASIAGLDF